MNQKDYGKNFSIAYDANIAELSKSSFKLPNTKKATGSFKLKLKKEQDVSLTPKVGSQSFTVKNVPQGQFITKDQIKIESFTPTGFITDTTAASGLTIEFFKNKFWAFPGRRTDAGENHYFSSDDGINWKDEGKPHDNYRSYNVLDSGPISVVYDNKIWVHSINKLFSATDPNGKNFQEVTINGGITFSYETSLVVMDNKMWLRNEDQLYSSTNGSDWTAVGSAITNRAQQISQMIPIAYQEKIYTLGGKDKDRNVLNKVYSLSKTGVLTEEAILGGSFFTISTKIFAGGILGIGGFSGLTTNKDLYYSLDGKNWKTLNVNSNVTNIGRFTGTLRKENEIWGIKSANPTKVFKITLQNLD